MHFPIVEISSTPLKRENWVSSNTLYDDATINQFTDYVGDKFNNEERWENIKNHLPYLFRGIANVNIENETITFLSKEEIINTLSEEVEETISRIKAEMSIRTYPSFFPFREHGNEFRGCSTLIWFEYGAYTSAQFIEDAPFYAGKTMYIGAIYDAHI